MLGSKGERTTNVVSNEGHQGKKASQAFTESNKVKQVYDPSWQLILTEELRQALYMILKVIPKEVYLTLTDRKRLILINTDYIFTWL